MKTLFLLMILIPIITNCSSKERTKWTDPNMRVIVDPDGLEARDYVRIVNALKKTGLFFIVDRKDGFKQILKEQKMIHRDRPDQFADIEKYAIWGRLHSVGGVVTGRVDCVRKNGWLHNYARCKQNLAIISTISGEVIATAEGENDDAELNWTGDVKIGSDWTDTVSELVDAYPKNYEQLKYSDDMRLFRQEAKEEGIRQKEEVGFDKAEKEM
jgi:hypothetical protein